MKQKIKIGAYEWTIIEKSTRMGNKLGTSEYEKLKITLKKDLLPSIRKVTLIHELLHAFISASGKFSMNAEEEDKIVDSFANQLVQFIQDNPEFFKNHILNDLKD